MGKLLPNEPLIYERANGVVFAFSTNPEIERWVIGGDPGSVAKAQGELLDYSEWKQMCEIAVTNPTLKKLMDKLVNTYYMIKEEQQ